MLIDAQDLVELVQQGYEALCYHGGGVDSSGIKALSTRKAMTPQVRRRASSDALNATLQRCLRLSLLRLPPAMMTIQ